jgi:hypothetical protein
VTQRNGEEADERLEPGLQQLAFDRDPADRVRPIADDHRQADAAGGLQAVRHRVDEGVDARADVLQIDHEDVEVLQHLRRRLAGFAVQRVHRHASPRVLRMRRLDHVVLQRRMEAMLRAEDRAEADARLGEHAIDDVGEVAIDRGGVGDHTDPLATQPAGLQEAFRSQGYRAQEGLSHRSSIG